MSCLLPLISIITASLRNHQQEHFRSNGSAQLRRQAIELCIAEPNERQCISTPFKGVNGDIERRSTAHQRIYVNISVRHSTRFSPKGEEPRGSQRKVRNPDKKVDCSIHRAYVKLEPDGYYSSMKMKTKMNMKTKMKMKLAKRKRRR